MKAFFGIISLVLSFGMTIPYCFDIVRGKAKPARSTRTLLLLLIIVTFFVQSNAFSSWVLLLSIGELATQVLLFGLGLKYGVGGRTWLDLICYGAFGTTLLVYAFTQNAQLSLTMLVLTDFIAFVPTIVKIWRDPNSDTWMFFVFGGMFAAAASLLARNSNSYSEIVYPAYILITNLAAATPILLHKRRISLG